MGSIQRQFVKLVLKVVSYPKATLVVCSALFVAAGVFAWFNLKLSTNQDELLTPRLPFFRDYQKYINKFPENESFVVLLEARDYGHPPPAKRWMAYADRIEAALMALKEDVRRVNTHTPVEELGEQALVFADWNEIREQSAHVKEFQQLVKIIGE